MENHKQEYDNVNNFNMVREMDTAQMNINPETGSEGTMMQLLAIIDINYNQGQQEQPTNYPQTTRTHYDDANE